MGILQHSLPTGLRTNPAEQASFLLCRSQGSVKKILFTLPALLTPPSLPRHHVLSLVMPANVNHAPFDALVCTRLNPELQGRGHPRTPTLSLLQQTPASLPLGKQPASKYRLISLGTQNCQTLAHADSVGTDAAQSPSPAPPRQVRAPSSSLHKLLLIPVLSSLRNQLFPPMCS